MHDMTFSTQRKLRLKLRINHCLLMCLHRASSCLALFLLEICWYAMPSCSKKEYLTGWFTYYLIDLFSFRRVSARGSLKKIPFFRRKPGLTRWSLKFWIKNGKKIIKLHNVGSYPTTKLFNVHGYQKEYKEKYW